MNSGVRALNEALAKTSPGLVWGIMSADSGDGTSEFEVSAGGIKANIPAVEALVAAAPDIPGWEIVAFKQPSEDFAVSYSGGTVEGRAVRITSTPTRDGKFDLDVYVPVSADTPQKAVGELGFILLDHMLGEYAVMQYLGRLNFIGTPAAPPESTPILEFAELIKRRATF